MGDKGSLPSTDCWAGREAREPNADLRPEQITDPSRFRALLEWAWVGKGRAGWSKNGVYASGDGGR